MNLAKCTLKTVSWKSSNQCHTHIECNQWICIENELSGLYFKLALTGNETSITNHEVHGFSNSFQHELKNPTNWMAKCIFAYNLRTRFCRHKVFGGITKATMVNHLTLKKTDIERPNFFQNHHWWFISELFWASLTKPNKPFQIYWQFVISYHYEHTWNVWPHPKQTSCSTVAFMYVLLYAKANSLSQVISEILKLKKLCYLIVQKHFK